MDAKNDGIEVYCSDSSGLQTQVYRCRGKLAGLESTHEADLVSRGTRLSVAEQQCLIPVAYTDVCQLDLDQARG